MLGNTVTKKLNKSQNFTTGFTLIELLVVISIIGLLSSVVLTSLTSARAKARDAKRMSDIRQILNTINLYASDHDGAALGGPGWFAEINNTCPSWAIYQNIVPGYISILPDDPLSPGAPTTCVGVDGYWYYYGNGYYYTGGATSFTWTGNSSNFVICSKLEKPKINITSPWGNVLNFCISM